MLEGKLGRLIRIGRLTVVRSDGPRWQFGDLDAAPDLDVAIRLKSNWTIFKLLAHPYLYIGETFMSGELAMEKGAVSDLLDLIGRNANLRAEKRRVPIHHRALYILGWAQQINSPRSARGNIHRHYDFSERLYRAFLDPDLQYSCAYFRTPNATLQEAQEAKKKHIAAKLSLQPGQKVLDIGCGWGGLALHLARAADVEVLGVTLSTEQLRVARQRALDCGLDKRVRFELIDYRAVRGAFDRIVSVGMFEHVGKPQYGEFFAAIGRLLERNGVALVHAIGRMRGPGVTSAWIRRHIFPGGYIPALSEVAPVIERAGLWLTDLEVLRLHYAQTLRLWRERFLRNRASLSDLYDERFLRMWEFYLAASEMTFRHFGFMVFQAQLSRDIAAVPLTRDYMAEAERTFGDSTPREAAELIA